jgi:hypothetical protein
MEPQSFRCKELNSVTNRNELGRGSSCLDVLVFCHYNKIPEVIDLQREKVILAHNFGGSSPRYLILCLCVCGEAVPHHGGTWWNKTAYTPSLGPKRGRERN